jgi:hypothetical protein
LTSYDERLSPPWWTWPAALVLALLVAAQIHSGADGVARSVVPYVVLPLLTVVVMLALSRGRVRVRDGVLHVPGARVALDDISGADPLDREATRRLRGPLAHPLAYSATRPWLPCAVRVALDDPDDDTPYWVVGSRRPHALAAALSPGRHDSGSWTQFMRE